MKLYSDVFFEVASVSLIPKRKNIYELMYHKNTYGSRQIILQYWDVLMFCVLKVKYNCSHLFGDWQDIDIDWHSIKLLIRGWFIAWFLYDPNWQCRLRVSDVNCIMLAYNNVRMCTHCLYSYRKSWQILHNLLRSD